PAAAAALSVPAMECGSPAWKPVATLAEETICSMASSSATGLPAVVSPRSAFRSICTEDIQHHPKSCCTIYGNSVAPITKICEAHYFNYLKCREGSRNERAISCCRGEGFF